MNRRISPGTLICLFSACCIFFGYSCKKDPVVSDTGTFIDSRDGNSYQWAKIGTQIWMTENLAYLPDVSPSAEGSGSDSFSYVYGYESIFVNTAKSGANYEAYGVLYNWPFAVKACPDGWHLPSDAEWDVLANFLGGDSVAGSRLKSKTGWKENGNGDNSSGFTGLPGGYRNKEGGFFLLGENAGFWTATASDSVNHSRVRDLGYNYPILGGSIYSNQGGFSIRCLRN